MATKVTVTLPNSVYQRAQRFARLHQLDIEEAISTLLEQALVAEEETMNWSEPDPAVEREREAYIALHPKLKEQYLGKYVAIYQGKLLDHDDNPAALSARIHARHLDGFVLITQVRHEPTRTIVVRSPRIVRDKVL